MGGRLFSGNGHGDAGAVDGVGGDATMTPRPNKKRCGEPLGCRARNGDPQQFFENVALQFASDDCLAWPYSHRRGYGALWLNGRMESVPRLICVAFHGQPPSPEHEAAHSCGNGHNSCCNHRHIRWATPTENCEDRAIHGTTACGTRHGSAKLTEIEVRIIRSLRGKHLQREIAEMFGVGRTQISRILLNQNWTGS